MTLPGLRHLFRSGRSRPGNRRNLPAPERAEEQRHLLAEVVNGIDQPVSVISRDFRYLFANDAYTGYHGVAPAEIIGRPMTDFFVGELFTDQMKPELERCFQGEDRRFRMETTFPVAGSRIVKVDLKPYRDPKGGIAGAVLYATDITGIMEQQRALEESERRFRAIARDMPYGVAIIDGPSATVTYANAAYDELFGRPRGASVGRTQDQFSRAIHREDRDGLLAELYAAIREKRPKVAYSYRLSQPRLSGETWITNVARFSYAADGTLENTLIVAHDVTREREEHHRLRDQANEKSLLMRELNHRVKNNLMLVSALVDLKNEDLPAGTDLSDLAHRIDAVRFLHELLQDQEEISIVSLGAYLRAVLDSVFSVSAVPVEVWVDTGDTQVPAQSATTIGLIVTEIATNAMKHGFAGAVDPPSFEVRAKPRDSMWHLELKSSGPPLNGEGQRRRSGTSGFQLVEALTQQLGADLSVQSAPSPVFTLKIPQSSLDVSDRRQ